MSEQADLHTPEMALRQEVSWMPGAKLASCPACKRVFLAPADKQNLSCPLCYAAELSVHPSLVRKASPESLIPLTINDNQIQTILNGFAEGIPQRSPDLEPANLRERLQLVWWPQWLVDGDLEGEWTGTVGFDYQVKTAQESFRERGWQSKSKLRTETRYEPRRGRLQRHYDNLPVPALRNRDERYQQIGKYDNSKATFFKQGAMVNNFVQMPELEPQELTEIAQNRLQAQAIKEIAQATGADRRREINFHGQYQNLNWTEFLLPLLSTFYLDDNGVKQAVILNGQSGKIYGRRLASLKKARRLSLLLAILPALALLAAILVFVFSQNTGLLSTMVLVGMGAVFALVLSVIPLARASLWNSSERNNKKAFQ